MPPAVAASARPEITARDLTVRGTVVLGCVTLALITALDLIDGHVGLPFSVGFVLVVVTLPLAIDVRELFPAGVLPPVLLLAALLLLTMFAPDAIAGSGLAADAGFVTRYLAAVMDHAITLVVGHVLALGVIVWRILQDV